MKRPVGLRDIWLTGWGWLLVASNRWGLLCYITCFSKAINGGPHSDNQLAGLNQSNIPCNHKLPLQEIQWKDSSWINGHPSQEYNTLQSKVIKHRFVLFLTNTLQMKTLMKTYRFVESNFRKKPIRVSIYIFWVWDISSAAILKTNCRIYNNE